MADLRLAAGLLAYVPAFLAVALGLSRLVHSAIDFFSSEGSLVFGLAFAFLVATLTAFFRRLEGRPVSSELVRGRWTAPALASCAMLGALAYVVVVLTQ